MKNIKIENLRFVAILLVVLGHSIIIYNPHWGLIQSPIESNFLKYLCLFIYIFHMPLFFFISGYLFNNINFDNINFWMIFTKKIKRLIVPYLFVSILYLVPIRTLINYPNYVNNSFLYNVIVNILLGRDNGHLWFLISLFLDFISFYFLRKVVRNDKLLFIICFIISIIGYFYIGAPLQYLFWFSYGYFIAKIGFATRCFNKTKMCCIILFLVLLIFLYLFIFDNSSYYIICIILKYIINLILLPFLYIIIPSKSNKFVQNISKYSFGIYLFHSPLIYFVFYSDIVYYPILTIFINFVLLGFLSYVLSYLLYNSKLHFIVGK